VNGALAFDGANDYVALGTLDVTGGTITLAAWFKADAFSGQGNRIVDKSTGSTEANHYWMLGTYYLSGVGEVLRTRLRANGTVTTFLAPTGALSPNVWYHGAATYDGATIILYLNGVEVGRTPKTGMLDTDNTVPAQLGRNTSGLTVTHWDGLLDDVRIYTRALSAAEITALYNAAAADTQAPTVSLTAPADGATVSSPVTVSATASDNVGVAGVQFLVDGANLGAEDPTAPYSISATVATGQPHAYRTRPGCRGQYDDHGHGERGHLQYDAPHSSQSAAREPAEQYGARPRRVHHEPAHHGLRATRDPDHRLQPLHV